MDMKTHRIRKLVSEDAGVHSMDVTADFKRMCLGLSDGRVRIIDMQSGEDILDKQVSVQPTMITLMSMEVSGAMGCSRMLAGSVVVKTSVGSQVVRATASSAMEGTAMAVIVSP